jgi:hypothetical protein
MDCDALHLVLNEKTQPIQWTEWQTGALVAAGLLWPSPWISSKGGLGHGRILGVTVDYTRKIVEFGKCLTYIHFLSKNNLTCIPFLSRKGLEVM